MVKKKRSGKSGWAANRAKQQTDLSQRLYAVLLKRITEQTHARSEATPTSAQVHDQLADIVSKQRTILAPPEIGREQVAFEGSVSRQGSPLTFRSSITS
jgi:hypothetical protein